MSGKWNKNYLRIGLTITISICICIVFNQLIHGWRSILKGIGVLISAFTPIIVGIVIAFLINPLMTCIQKGLSYIFTKGGPKDEKYDKVYNKMKAPSIVLTLIVFIGLVTLFLWIVIPRIYESITDLVNKMPDYLSDARSWAERVFAKSEFLEGKFSYCLDYVQNNVMGIVQDKVLPNMDVIVVNISSGVIVGVKAIFNFLVGIIVAVYLLNSKNEMLAQVKKIIYWIFPKKSGNKILEGASYANSVFGGFISGKILDSIIIGILCFIFTQAVGMEYAVLMSVIVGVTNVIPFFGPFIGAVPGALLALMDDPMMLIVFVIFIIVLQQFDGNILGPLILGDSTGLSGIWVLVAILVGGDLFGVMGMFLGVPVFACIYSLFAILLRDGLRKKNLSSVTADYFYLQGFDEETGEAVYHDKYAGRRSIKKEKKARKKHLIMLRKKSAEEEENQTDSDADTDADANSNPDANANAKTDDNISSKDKTDDAK